jgi:galactokinase
MSRFTAPDSADILHAAGMRRVEAERKARLADRAHRALQSLGVAGNRAMHSWFVPGRLEVFGKHTDYAGGRSLLCAIERGCVVVAAGRDDAHFRVVDANDGSVAHVSEAADEAAPAWSIYPGTVARRIGRNFPEARRGADIAFESDLPPAAGMSSSSVLMIAVFLALARVNEIESLDRYRAEIHSPEDLAGYLATIENGRNFGSLRGDCGVGTFGGSEDHTAILCCCANELAQYAFAPTRRERAVTLDSDLVFAIAASGVAAQKTGSARSAYNDAADRTTRILDVWRAATGREAPTLAAVIREGRPAMDRMRQVLDAHDDRSGAQTRLRERFEQFLEESERIVPEAVDLIAAGHVDRIGPLADRSQELAERVLGNQVPETISLARSARANGAMAASAFGAGFGGSVWALVRASDADAFMHRWAAAYRNAFPSAAANAEFFISRPGPAAMELRLSR